MRCVITVFFMLAHIWFLSETIVGLNVASLQALIRVPHNAVYLGHLSSVMCLECTTGSCIVALICIYLLLSPGSPLAVKTSLIISGCESALKGNFLAGSCTSRVTHFLQVLLISLAAFLCDYEFTYYK